MQNVEQTIISQYANSPTLVRLIYNMNAYIDPSANIDNFYKLIFDVDTAVGYGLDVWGRIVGVSRILQIEQGAYFGFTGPGGASGVPFGQGVFYHGRSITGNFVLTDAAFRILILAKALKNISNATIPSINQILINVFGPNGLIPVAGNTYCTDGRNMTMTYTFSAPIPPLASSVIYQSGVIPRPAGVLSTVVVPSITFWNDGGLLVLLALSGYPTSPSGLLAGAVWSNGLAVAVVPGITPDPTAPPVYFGEISAAELAVLGGGNLPTSDPANIRQLWNNGGQIAISFG